MQVHGGREAHYRQQALTRQQSLPDKSGAICEAPLPERWAVLDEPLRLVGGLFGFIGVLYGVLQADILIARQTFPRGAGSDTPISLSKQTPSIHTRGARAYWFAFTCQQPLPNTKELVFRPACTPAEFSFPWGNPSIKRTVLLTSSP